MMSLAVKIEFMETKTIYGLWKKTNDKTIRKDINYLSTKYHEIVSISKGKVLPYFVLSKNYDEISKNCEMLIGGDIVHDNLESFILPAGDYAIITIKPKMGFLWGASVGEAKRYFYTKWLLENPYEALNMEYEYHTEKAIGKHPTIDIIFAIRKKI